MSAFFCSKFLNSIHVTFISRGKFSSILGVATHAFNLHTGEAEADTSLWLYSVSSRPAVAARGDPIFKTNETEQNSIYYYYVWQAIIE